MPDLEIDLVDQFICPLCVASEYRNIPVPLSQDADLLRPCPEHPTLSLKTTYKARCLFGRVHADPSAASACHRPARGVFSKYCSDECGRKYMQSRIDAWEQMGGKKEKLWESVKNAEKREGVVVRAAASDDDANKLTMHPVKTEPDTNANVKSGVNAKPKKTKAEQATEMLVLELDQIMRQREQIRQEMEVALWRRRLLDLAGARAEHVDQCGWDQRLCFGDEEWVEFGPGVWESYGAEEGRTGGQESMDVDGAPEDEGAWWCSGKKVCERHAG